MHFVAVPSGPPDSVKENVINSTSAQVFWLPPQEDQQNGEILSYTVIISGYEGNHLVVYNFTAYSTLINLPNLRPFSEYNVSIAASTLVGTGPFTALHVFHTPEDG